MAPRKPSARAVAVEARVLETPTKGAAEAAADSTAVATPPKLAAKPSLVQQTNKACKDNFIRKGWSPELMHTLVRNGKSIWQHIYDAKEAAEQGGPTVGGILYADLKASLFQELRNPSQVLKVDNAADPEDPAISSMLLALTGPSLNSAEFEMYIDRDMVPCDQKACKAIYAALLEVPPNTEAGSRVLLLAFDWIKRHNLHEVYPELWKAISEHLDRAAEKAAMVNRGLKLSCDVWYDAHEEYIGLIVRKDSLLQCVQHKGDWKDMKDHLVEVCKAHCGRFLFGHRLAALADNVISGRIDEAVQELDGKAIDKDSIGNVLAAVEEACKQIGKDAHALVRSAWMVKYAFGGIQCETKVFSFWQEAHVKIMAKATMRALAGKQLASLWCELDFFSAAQLAQPAHGVSEAVLKPMKVARKAAQQMLSSGSGGEIVKTLRKGHKVLSGHYKWWQVDRDFWLSVQGAPGERQVQQNVLAVLPKADDASFTLERAQREISAIQASKLHAFVSCECQNQVSEVLKVVDSLVACRPPKWPVTNTDFLAAARVAINNACGFVPKPGEAAAAAAAAANVVGKPAIAAFIERCRAMQAQQPPQALTFDDLKPFRLFPWLLDATQVELTDGWLSQVLGGFSGVAVQSKQKKGASAKQEKLEQELAKSNKRKLAQLYA